MKTETELEQSNKIQNLQGEIRSLLDALNTQQYKVSELEIENNRLLQERKKIIEENASIGDKIDRLEFDIKYIERVASVYDQEYQDLCRIVLDLYKTDKEAIKQMIDEMPGDVFSKFQKHIGV